ncbi:MAG: sensor histidine kinase, partial [Bacteroidia bacterium]|nr:sensor histidine kinase [Bacteroidia bacterium]
FWSMISLLGGMYLSYYPFRTFYEWSDYIPYTLNYLAGTLGILGAAVAFKIIKSNIDNQKEINDLQQIKTNTELKFLKDQINPHFLFNNLNNIYVQSRKTPELVPDSIMQLSDLMRYQLYDANKESVPLSQEIQFLKNYIAVEELRREHLNADVTVSGNVNQVSVAPLIFLPFIENVFKHGNFTDPEHAFLKVSWHVTQNNIVFICQNSTAEKPQITNHRIGGIGLNNVRRRLDINYPNTYEIDVADIDKVYKVHLKIKTKNSEMYNRR